eukprot:6208991-Pleurochrysis_carterae.AAC.3
MNAHGGVNRAPASMYSGAKSEPKRAAIDTNALYRYRNPSIRAYVRVPTNQPSLATLWKVQAIVQTSVPSSQTFLNTRCINQLYVSAVAQDLGYLMQQLHASADGT